MAESPACPGCGMVLEGEAAKEALEVLIEKDAVISDQATQIASLRGRVRRLENEKRKKADDPDADKAWEVFRYWQANLSPRAREFTGKRFDNTLARIHAGEPDLIVEQLKRAVDGAGLKPYVVNGARVASGLPDQRYCDLELICRSEAKVQAFIAIADAEDARLATSAAVKPVVSAAKLADWQRRLTEPVMDRLTELRGWSPEAMRLLQLGLDGDRIVFPIQNEAGVVTGVCRYKPNRSSKETKMLAEGDRGLFPAPEAVASQDASCWLVEGEPDAVALRSLGFLRGVGVPGVNTWKDGWTERFAGFERVYIAFDCDDKGREAGAQRARDLSAVTQAITVDLDPDRDDGYDVGDLLIEHGAQRAREILTKLAVSPAATVTPMEPKREKRREPPFDLVVQALEALELKVQHRAKGRAESQCPVPEHDDRKPSLSVSEGDDGRVLLHCHAGCEVEQIVLALGYEMTDLFAA